MAQFKKIKKIPRKSTTLCYECVTYRNYWGADFLVGRFADAEEADAFFESVCAYFSLPPETRKGALWLKSNVGNG